VAGVRSYRISCVAYGKYDLVFAVEAEDKNQSLEVARNELAEDGITSYTDLSSWEI
jgi:uncharacterized protein with GYD domain